MENTNTDTRCPHCGASVFDRNMYGLIFDCGSTLYDPKVAKSHVHDLCREREAHAKTREEFEVARNGLGLKIDELRLKLEKSDAENARLRELADGLLVWVDDLGWHSKYFAKLEHITQNK